MGASTRRVGISTGPMLHVVRRFTCIEREIVASDTLDRPSGASYHSRPQRRVGAPPFLQFGVRRPVLKEVILTPEGFKRLKAEIEHLSTTKRRGVADRIRVAREFGDIAENAEYDDAKNEQMLLEHRIATLEERLK